MMHRRTNIFFIHHESILSINIHELCVYIGQHEHIIVITWYSRRHYLKIRTHVQYSSRLKSYTYRVLRSIDYIHSYYNIGSKNIFNIRIEDT